MTHALAVGVNRLPSLYMTNYLQAHASISRRFVQFLALSRLAFTGRFYLQATAVALRLSDVADVCVLDVF